jgi:hypothetical protein
MFAKPFAPLARSGAVTATAVARLHELPQATVKLNLA